MIHQDKAIIIDVVHKLVEGLESDYIEVESDQEK